MIKNIAWLLVLFVLLTACKQNAPASGEEMDAKAERISAEDLTQIVEVEEQSKELPPVYRLMGKFSPSADTNFVKIDQKYTDKAAIYLQKECYESFIDMHNAARAEGVELRILSATRPFDYQKAIWERKWKQLLARGDSNEVAMAKGILQYSAMPGTSRHHWGTDIDLNYLSNKYFEAGGEGQAIYAWLLENAADYGFCQPYTPKGEGRQNGYEEEKWHWSYIPLAEKYFQVAKDSLRNEMIKGFSGAQGAVQLKVVENYVLSINQACI